MKVFIPQRWSRMIRPSLSLPIINNYCLRSIARCFKTSPLVHETNLDRVKDDRLRLRRIRNLGIFAHVDAGKTTVTERMLALAGVIHRAGSVDEGNTVTDYLPAERERGITIQAAAISFDWTRHNNWSNEPTDFVNIHLIDTPGHVDFSIEVNRSVAALDGALLVVDSVAGVQAQTETVWRAITNQVRKEGKVDSAHEKRRKTSQHHAEHEPLSCIAFINKMDKDGCNFNAAVTSLKRKLAGANPIPIQIPLFRLGSKSIDLSTLNHTQILKHLVAMSPSVDTPIHGTFVGVVDLIHMRAIIYPETRATDIPIVESCIPIVIELIDTKMQPQIDTELQVITEAMKARKSILESIADYDELMEECFLSDTMPSNQALQEAIRRATISRKILPILTGSAVRGKGVEPLLDAVADFLPSPLDRSPPTLVLHQEVTKKKNIPTEGKESLSDDKDIIKLGHPLHPTLIALAFKVIHMKNRGGSGDGRVVFARIFSGKISTKDTLSIISPCSPGEIINIRSERVSGMMELAGGRFDNMENGLCKSGDVCALIGLKSVITGDTILLSSESHPSSHALEKKNKVKGGDPLHEKFECISHRFSLAGVSSPKPVLSVRIEAQSSEEQRKLSDALRLLSIEDPSLNVQETDVSTIISGLGELHIEIILDRLRREYGLSVFTGKPVVSYRETVMGLIESPGLIEFDRMIGANRLRASIQLSIEPLTSMAEPSTESLYFDLVEPVVDLGKKAREFLGLSSHADISDLLVQSELAQSLVSGCQGALKRGSIGSFSLANVRCTVTQIEAPGGAASLQSLPGSLRAAASYAVIETLNQNKSSCSTLEPAMGIEISVPAQMVGSVVSDISSRRGTIGEVIIDDNALVVGVVPLVEILGYASILRSLTGGEGTFTAEYKGHSPCSLSHI